MTNARKTPDGARLIAAVAMRITHLVNESNQDRGQVAQRSNISDGTLRRIMDGTSNPTLTTMVALASALELRSIEELIGPLPPYPSRSVQSGEPGEP